MIEVLPLGGMNEIGRNMTAIGFDGKYIIVDMGIRLDSILAFEDVEIGKMTKDELVNINAIPDDTLLRGKRVEAIVLTHGHLDHVGAVGKLAAAYDAPIYGTPFTSEITKQIIKEESGPTPRLDLRRQIPPGDSVDAGKISIEFIPITHSILQTSAILLRKGSESIIVASDFKLDDEPLLGYKTDTRRLKEIGNEGLLAAMVGSVRLDEEGPTGSEAHAKEMLRDAMSDAFTTRGLVFVTTFSSHITRLKSIVDLAFELGRTPVMIGRSIKNYTKIAMHLNLVDFPAELQILGRPNAIRNILKKIEQSRSDYVLICTGHQGEPTSVLTKIADGRIPPSIKRGDEVIFSASVIPNPINQSNRAIQETKLEAQGAHIHRNVHVSGHAGRVDTAEFLNMIKPQHIIPCHGTPEKLRTMAELSQQIGYSSDQVHVFGNGISLKLGG